MKINNLSWIKRDNSITVILPNGQPKTISSEDSNFEKVLEAIKARNWDVIPDLLDVKSKIFNFSDGVFKVVDGVVNVNGKPVPDSLSKKIIAFAKEGLPYKPLLNFWDKLSKNPSWRNVQGLFEFLELKGYALTEDGDFIAYKGVRSDWTDRYSGKISNKIGETVSVPRNEVNDNPEIECQFGLHVADYAFASSYAGNDGHMIMVSVNPEHVVSMPNAYQFTKMRVCQYTVLKEVFEEKKESLYQNTVDNSSYNDGNDDYCNDCDCEECCCDDEDW